MEIRDLYKSVGMRPDFRTLSAMVDLWRRGARDRDVPSRADLDLSGLGPVLGHAFLIDVNHAPLRFRVRQTGAVIDQTFGRSFAGHWIDDPSAAYFERGNLDDYVNTVAHKRPHFACGQAQSAADASIHYMRLLLPLSSDGSAVDMILGGVVTSLGSRLGTSDETFPGHATERRSAIAG